MNSSKRTEAIGARYSIVQTAVLGAAGSHDPVMLVIEGGSGPHLDLDRSFSARNARSRVGVPEDGVEDADKRALDAF